MKKYENKNFSKLSEIVVERLSKYLKCFHIMNERGYEYVTSSEIAKSFKLNSEQMRKDFSYIGSFGKRGVGYNIVQTIKFLSDTLKLNKHYNIGIVGAGHLGNAIADYPRLNSDCFKVVAMFDVDLDLIGTKSNTGVPIYHVFKLNELVKELEISIGIISVPGNKAQSIANKLIKAGITSIMNFSPALLKLPENVKEVGLDIKTSMEVLTYFMS